MLPYRDMLSCEAAVTQHLPDVSSPQQLNLELGQNGHHFRSDGSLPAFNKDGARRQEEARSWWKKWQVSDRCLEEQKVGRMGEGRSVLAGEVQHTATGKELPGRKIDAPWWHWQADVTQVRGSVGGTFQAPHSCFSASDRQMHRKAASQWRRRNHVCSFAQMRSHSHSFIKSYSCCLYSKCCLYYCIKSLLCDILANTAMDQLLPHYLPLPPSLLPPLLPQLHNRCLM